MKARRILNAYSSIITKNIALFLASGVLNILFSQNGWFPNPDMIELDTILMNMVIPLFLAYSAGQKSGQFLGQPIRNNMGGIAGVLTGCCLLAVRQSVSILVVIVLAAIAGYLSSWIYNHVEVKFPSGFMMMGRNLITVTVGLTLGFSSARLVLPVLETGSVHVKPILEAACSSSFLFLTNLFIEPLKVFFLNNSLNHGILIPLGFDQMKEMGSSILFLMETNPGPGLGILMAYWIMKKEERAGLLPVIAGEFLGGIHELYFPYVLLDLRLLAAVMAGGVCGTCIFSWMEVGAAGAISPGSVLTILMMVSLQEWGKVLLGIFLSALVSGVIAVIILKERKTSVQERSFPDEMQESGLPEGSLQEEVKKSEVQTSSLTEKSEAKEVQKLEEKKMKIPESIHQIYVVCDAGMGSSAMGAALLRKQLKEAGILDIQVRAAAADDIPKGGDMLICQKDFYDQCLKQRTRELPYIYVVDQLAHRGAYTAFVEQLSLRS